MPEGDTLHRLARAMEPKLVGKRLERVTMEQRERPALRHGEVLGVEARGKHLLIQVGDLWLRTHLGLHGSWHRYPRHRPWKRPRSQASLVIDTDLETFVCFNASSVDCIESSRLPLHRPLSRLGPDLVSEDVDFAEIVRRARLWHASDAVANLLLDQKVACGIGNVFKNEVLFLTGHAPTKPLSRLSDDDVAELYQQARGQLQANVDRPLRTTTDDLERRRGRREREPRYWVYRRADQPCLRCHAPIRFTRLRRRSTYWCPECQRS